MSGFGFAHDFLGKLILPAGLLLAGMSVGACADPESEFNAFVDRWDRINANAPDASPDVDPGDGGDCVPITQDDVPNGYLFTLSAVITPTKPFVALATATIDSDASPPTITFSVQPLSAADRTTPVGDVIPGGPFAIEPDGSFVGDFGVIAMDGAANPISGSELQTELVLTGQAGGLCKGSDFSCGTVTGIASKPIKDLNLAGSTFTLQLLAEAGNYPTALLNCAKKPAP
jgi:hypothetical protein